MRTPFTLAVSSALVVIAAPAWAAPEDDVKGLLAKGSAAYDELDFDAARTHFEKALIVSVRNPGKVSGPLLAKLQIRLGVIYLSIDGDKAKGVKAFTDALKADPKARVDASLSTPEIDAAFAEALKAAGLGEATPPAPVAPVLLGHKPPREATANTPLRVRVEVPEGIKTSKITAFYRPLGQTKFTSLPLEEMVTNTYQANIPAEKIKGRSIEYYVSAENEAGKVVALSGSSEAPHLVQIVSTELDPGGATSATGKGKKPKPEAPRKPHTYALLLSAGSTIGTLSKVDDLNTPNVVGVGSQLLVIAPELAVYASEKLTLGAIGRIQIVGSQGVDPNKNNLPRAGAGARLRYFYGDPKNSLRGFVAGEAGFSQMTQHFALTINSQGATREIRSDRNEGPYAGMSWGFEKDLSSSAALTMNNTLRGHFDLGEKLPLFQYELTLGVRFGN